jgi:hypothetical protein
MIALRDLDAEVLRMCKAIIKTTGSNQNRRDRSRSIQAAPNDCCLEVPLLRLRVSPGS